MKKILRFFDKLEDNVRGTLSKYPLIYSLIGGVGVVLFWKGVWETAEMFPVLNGPMSILVSVSILLTTGLFVSFFVTDRIILSGIKQEKKMVEKTEAEIRAEAGILHNLEHEVGDIKKEIKNIENVLIKK